MKKSDLSKDLIRRDRTWLVDQTEPTELTEKSDLTELAEPA